MTKVKTELVTVTVIVPKVRNAGKLLNKGESIQVSEAMASVLVLHGFELKGVK